MVYSPFGCLIIVTYCIFKYFGFILKPQKLHSPPGAQPEISSKEVWKKKYPFWMKTYLIWKAGGEGLPRALIKKI